MTELERARTEINAVDKEMSALFARRMQAVKTVAEYKRKNGLQVTDTAREEEIIRKNSALFEDSELKPYYVSFMRSNMEISKSYQHRLLDGMRVSYSGVPGAFAEIAAQRIFPDAAVVPFSDFKAAYNAVSDGECDCAVLPLENSYEGDVGQVMDLAFFGSLYINGIFDIEVVQNLAGIKGAALNGITKVISHPQALGQCMGYIGRHGLSAVEAVNTAVAAKTVADLKSADTAAICSAEAAEKYGLEILETHINESSGNTTRFAVFSRSPKEKRAENCRFIMLFTVKNEAGSLGKATAIIGENGFNLRALKSRPTKELIWEYYFFAEGEGDIDSENGKRMISGLKNSCSNLKIVGSFAKDIKL